MLTTISGDADTSPNWSALLWWVPALTAFKVNWKCLSEALKLCSLLESTLPLFWLALSLYEQSICQTIVESRSYWSSCLDILHSFSPTGCMRGGQKYPIMTGCTLSSCLNKLALPQQTNTTRIYNQIEYVKCLTKVLEPFYFFKLQLQILIGFYWMFFFHLKNQKIIICIHIDPNLLL